MWTTIFTNRKDSFQRLSKYHWCLSSESSAEASCSKHRSQLQKDEHRSPLPVCGFGGGRVSVLPAPPSNNHAWDRSDGEVQEKQFFVGHAATLFVYGRFDSKQWLGRSGPSRGGIGQTGWTALCRAEQSLTSSKALLTSLANCRHYQASLTSHSTRGPDLQVLYNMPKGSCDTKIPYIGEWGDAA